MSLGPGKGRRGGGREEEPKENKDEMEGKAPKRMARMTPPIAPLRSSAVRRRVHVLIQKSAMTNGDDYFDRALMLDSDLGLNAIHAAFWYLV